MTKAAICAHCWDIVSPYRNWQTDRRWRWCQCEHAAVRWRDGTQGLLEITAQHGPDYVRVLGINNGFLHTSMDLLATMMTDEWWRECHAMSTERVAANYLFHKDRRACWALLTKPGESGDVFWMDPGPVWSEHLAAEQEEAKRANSPAGKGETAQDPWAANDVYTVPCPTCGRMASAYCVNAQGREVYPAHAARYQRLTEPMDVPLAADSRAGQAGGED